ncbi:MAG: hypothetical protein ACK4UJ_00895 [Leptonema sp. (in: bacteria)]
MYKKKIKLVIFILLEFLYGPVYSQEIKNEIFMDTPKIYQQNPNHKKPKIKIENIDSNTFFFGEEQSKGVIRFFGRIKVSIGNGFLYADEVIIDTNRKEFFAYGNIEYYEENSYIQVEKVIYDYEADYGIFYNGSGYKDPVYFTGIHIVGIGEKRFEISDAYFTSCSKEKPHYHFTAKKVFLFENNEILALGVWYYIGGVPLVPLPFYYSNEWGTGVITQFGYSNISGYYLQNTYQFSVPLAFLNPILPIAYRLKLDYYEKKGFFFGSEMYRFSPLFSYIFDLGFSEFKRYEIIPDYREKDLIRTTNQILQKDGTYKEEKYKWTKVFAILSYNYNDPEKNRVQKISLRFVNYSHRLFEYEFGARIIPTATLPALYRNTDAGRGLIQNENEFVIYYNDKIDDLTINLQAYRKKIWKESSNFADSKYIPINDVLPNLDIRKNHFLGYFLSLPFYWDLNYHYDQSKTYSDKKPYYTQHTNRAETNINTFFSFFDFISFRTLIGYGAQKITPVKENISEDAFKSLTIYTKKQSYEYTFQKHQWILGVPELNFEFNYTKKETFKEELLDTNLVNLTGFNNRQKINETQVKFNFYPFDFFNFTAESIYDHREFEFKRPYLERWSYPIVRTEFYLNFLNLFKESRYHLLSKKRIHRFELKISNDYVYDHLNTRDHSNLLGISFIMSNFDLLFLKRLRYLEIGYFWYHIYYQPQLDHMRYLSKLDIQITKQIYFEMEIESRLTQPERYSKQEECRFVDGNLKCIPNPWLPDSEKKTSFWQDVIDSTGIRGIDKRKNSAFSIGFFRGIFIFDLHDWELKIGYELQQKSILAGVNTISVINFYDNIVFFSFNFVKFDIGGLQTQPSRFIINRQKVNPYDIGKTQFYIY